MTMFLCWNPLTCGHTIDDAKQIRATDAEEAAEKYAEANFSEWDYPTETRIHVLSLPTAEEPPPTEQVFEVVVESIPHFSASLWCRR